MNLFEKLEKYLDVADTENINVGKDENGDSFENYSFKKRVSSIVFLTALGCSFFYLFPSFLPALLIGLMFIILGIIIFFAKYSKYKVVRVIFFIFRIPFLILVVFYRLYIIFFEVLLASLLTLTPFVALIFILPLLGVNISGETVVFIYLTIPSIIMSAWGDKILFSYYKNIRNNREKEYEVTVKLINQKRIRLFLFTIYFLLLFVSNILFLNDYFDVQSQRMLNAFLYSFAVFVAFDRVISNWSLIKPEKSSNDVNSQDKKE
jgi:hypothetical protein